jgi:hypothetical protein
MHHIVNALFFGLIYAQNEHFWTNGSSLTIPLSSIVFVSSSPHKKFHCLHLVYYTNISRPLPFSTGAPLLSLPPQNPLDHVGG